MEVAVEITRSSDFKQVYVIGAIGGHSPYDFRIAFYNDSPRVKMEDGKQVTIMEREIKSEIILSPPAAKEFANWLNLHLAEYEKAYGEIRGTAPQAGAQAVEIGGATRSEESKSTQIQGYM